jgi:hypothetical protein
MTFFVSKSIEDKINVESVLNNESLLFTLVCKDIDGKILNFNLKKIDFLKNNKILLFFDIDIILLPKIYFLEIIPDKIIFNNRKINLHDQFKIKTCRKKKDKYILKLIVQIQEDKNDKD